MFIITTGTHTKRRITTTKHLAFRFWFRVNHKQNTHSMRIDSNKSVRIWLLFLFNFFFAVLTVSQFATLAYPGYYAGCMRIIFTRAKLTTKGNHTLDIFPASSPSSYHPFNFNATALSWAIHNTIQCRRYFRLLCAFVHFIFRFFIFRFRPSAPMITKTKWNTHTHIHISVYQLKLCLLFMWNVFFLFFVCCRCCCLGDLLHFIGFDVCVCVKGMKGLKKNFLIVFDLKFECMVAWTWNRMITHA